MARDFRTVPTVNGKAVLLDGDAAPASHVGSPDGHPLATATEQGMISAASQAKLDGLSAQAVGAFHAHGTVNQVDIPHATFTKVLFPSEEAADVSGWYDAANSRYAPQRAGYYAISTKIHLGPTVDAKRTVLSLFKNGVRYKDLSYQHTSGAQPDIGVAGAVSRAYANGTTDYFEVFVWHDFGVSTSDLIVNPNSTWFAGGFEGMA